MGRQIRFFEAGVVYSVVQTVVDRAFMFAPNHAQGGHPLLAKGCPARSLQPGDARIPKASVINIVGAAAARALELAPVNLHALGCSINHSHAVISAKDGDIAAISEFLRVFHSAVARGVNALREREGHLFSGPPRITACANDAEALEQVLYALANPVKDGLVNSVKRTPFFSTYARQAQGKALEYWEIEWADFYAAGGRRNGKLQPKQFLKWRELEIAPLPHLRGMSEHRRRTLIRKSVAAVEEKTAREFKAADKKLGPVSRHFETDPRSRPKTPRESGPKPLVHASSVEEAEAYREKYLEVRRAHAAASIAFRRGELDVEFPAGTFRPPLIRLVAGSS